MACHFVYCDNAQRSSGTPSNFTINIAEGLDVEDDSQLRVDHFICNNEWSTANLANSNIYVLESWTGRVRQLALPIGQYSAPELATILASAFGSGYAVTYAAKTNSLTISNGYNFPCNLEPSRLTS